MFAEAGELDVCAAVAGVWPEDDVPVWELSLERWRETLDANLTATFLTARGFLREPRRPRGLARPRRLDRGHLRRGRPRRLRRREVGDPRRAAPLAEERGRPPQPARAGERRRAGLDGLADDRATSSTTAAVARITRTMALPKVATAEDVAAQVVALSLAADLRPRHRPGRHRRRRHGGPDDPRLTARRATHDAARPRLPLTLTKTDGGRGRRHTLAAGMIAVSSRARESAIDVGRIRPRHIGPARHLQSSTVDARLDPSPIWWFTASLDCGDRAVRLASVTWPAASRHALHEGPPIVADGGMGSLLTAAVPRLRSPEEANLRAPGGGRLAARQLHQRRRRADRDEHVRRQPPQARRPLPRRRARADQLDRGEARPRGARADRPRRLHRRRDRAARGGGEPGEAPRALRRAGGGARRAAAPTSSCSRRSTTSRSSSTRSRPSARVSALPIVALLTFDEDAETLAGVTRARRRPSASPSSSVAAFGANHGAGLLAALTALEQMQATGAPLAALPNIGLASLARRQGDLPARDARLLRRVRRARARPRRARDRRLLRHDPDRDRGDPGRDRRGTAGRALRLDDDAREVAVALGEEQRETGSRERCARASSSSRCSSTRRSAARAAALLDVARELEASGLVRFVDVNDNATARAGISALMVSGAIERATGLETIPHLTTRDSTVLGLESQLLGAHAEGVRNVLAITGDPPEVGDYPGSQGVYEIDSIGLTEPDRAAEPRRGLQRPADRRADVVLPGRRGQPDRRRPRARGRALPREDRGRRQVRDDADRLRPRRARPLRASCSAAGRCPCSPAIFPLTSYRLALRLHNEVPGIIVPDALQRALDEAGAGAAEVGMAHATRAARRGARALRRRLRRRAVPQADARCSSCSPSSPPASVDELRGERGDASGRAGCRAGGRPCRAAAAPRTARTSRRTFGWPGTWSATAPTTQTSTSPQSAPTASPPSESSSRSGGSSRSPLRIVRASTPRRPAGRRRCRRSHRRARRAPCSASLRPAARKCGATRAPHGPRRAPARRARARSRSSRAGTRRGRRSPTTATMIQSRSVIARSSPPARAALSGRVRAALVLAGSRRQAVLADVDELAAAVVRAGERHGQEAVVDAEPRGRLAAGGKDSHRVAACRRALVVREPPGRAELRTGGWNGGGGRGGGRDSGDARGYRRSCGVVAPRGEQNDHDCHSEADDDERGDRLPALSTRPHRAMVVAMPRQSRPAGYTAHRPGGVVQLVRTPACHAGGRGFESRRSRSLPPAAPRSK